MTTGYHVEFLKHKILFAEVWMIEAHNRAKFCGNWPIHSEDIAIFQDGSRPPSWICWTTHSENLAVSNTMQNLVMIDAVSSF